MTVPILLTYWLTILLAGVFLAAAIELCLRAARIGTFHPDIRICPWSRVPRILWNALTEDRIHIFEMLSRLQKHGSRSI